MSCHCSDSSGGLRNSPYDMVPMQEAIDMVIKTAQPLMTTAVSLHEALGCVLAETVKSKEPLPPFRASIMDGYAVIASDGVGEFPIISRVAAGDTPGTLLTSGQVSYVTTGCPVPDGADAVVKIEDTEGISDDAGNEIAIKILQGVSSGTNIRPIGFDIKRDEIIVEAGETITPAVIGLFATVGVTNVSVYRKPIVGVLSTGSELVDASQSIHDGKIRDSNRPMLLAYLQQYNVETVDLGICRDKWDSLRALVLNQLPHIDVLITSGGVSMGDHDLVKPLLKELGTIHFGRIHMKPGKPTTFATVLVNETPKLVFALPGNPVSCLVTTCLLVQPALKRLQGYTPTEATPLNFRARLQHALPLDRERPEYHRAVVEWKDNEWIATSTGIQASSRLLSCRHANALLYLPVGTRMEAGSLVDCIFLTDTGLSSTQTPPVPDVIPASTPTQISSTKKDLRIRACILTVSDRVSRGEADDRSGPTMQKKLLSMPGLDVEIIQAAVVPDELDEIRDIVKRWCDEQRVDLIVTSGGTGFSPRDITPEAVKTLLHREAPGLVHKMMQASLEVTPMAILARPVAGTRGQTLIVTLPGKPNAVVETIDALALVLPHALHLLQDVSHGHHQGKKSP